MADEAIDVRDATGGTQSIAVDTVSGAQYQRVKLDAGGDGSSVSITAGQQTAAASLPVVLASDGTLIPGTSASALGKAEDAAHTSGDVGVMALSVRQNTAAALSGTDADYQPLITDTNGRLHVISGNLPAAAALADAAAVPTTSKVGSVPMLYNGATLDFMRNNIEGTLLASAARTVQTTSGTMTNYNARGVIVFLNITVASGTGGLQVYIRYLDPISGGSVRFALPTALIATGLYGYLLYPGASAAGVAGVSLVQQVISAALGRSWHAGVLPGDASSYTYSLGYSYIL